MHVLIDARLLHRPMSGVERVQYNFVKELSRRTDIRRLTVLIQAGTQVPADLDGDFDVVEVCDTETVLRVLRDPKDPPDVFHMTAVPDRPWDILLMPYAKAVSVTVHDAILNRHPEYLPDREIWEWFDAYTKLIVKAADALMGHSESVVREIGHELDGDVSKADAVYLAPNQAFAKRVRPEDIAAFRARFGVRERYFAALGKDYAHKDHATLVRALARMPDDVDVAISGGKVLGDDTVTDPVIRKLGLTERVHWLPSISEEELRAMLQGSHGLVFPSREEGFGLPPLEAMLSGVPAIVSNSMSVPEVCGDGAWMFEAGDVDALAQLMHRLLERGPDVAELIERGTRRVATFSWAKTVDKVVASYHKAIARAQERTDRWDLVPEMLENIGRSRASDGARIGELLRQLDAWKERCGHAEAELRERTGIDLGPPPDTEPKRPRWSLRRRIQKIRRALRNGR